MAHCTSTAGVHTYIHSYTYSTMQAYVYWVSKSKDTNGEQAMISARSLTPLHQRMDCKMRAKMRKRDMPNWAVTPVIQELITKPLQSQERNSLVKVLSRQNKQNCSHRQHTYMYGVHPSINREVYPF